MIFELKERSPEEKLAYLQMKLLELATCSVERDRLRERVVELEHALARRPMPPLLIPNQANAMDIIRPDKLSPKELGERWNEEVERLAEAADEAIEAAFIEGQSDDDRLQVLVRNKVAVAIELVRRWR